MQYNAHEDMLKCIIDSDVAYWLRAWCYYIGNEYGIITKCGCWFIVELGMVENMVTDVDDNSSYDS